jgi:hypothetical protein
MSEQLVLPRADEATIDPRKLKDYALNPDHPRGQHKARAFYQALELTQEDWEELRDQILEQLVSSPVVRVDAGEFGPTFYVDVPIEGRNGETRRVSTLWIVRGNDPPDLVTLYPRKA